MTRFNGAAILVAMLVVVVVLWNATFTVYQADRALVLRFGAAVRSADEPGLHFKIPFVEDVVTLSKQVLNIDGSQQELLTNDQKRVVVDYFARYRIVKPLLFYQSVKSEDQLEQRLQPIITSQMRRVLGGVEMARILTKERADLMREITLDVDAEAKNFGAHKEGFGIEVLDVRIRRVDLPQQNSEAIFTRMKTQRQQQAALIRAEGGREKQTMTAEADKQRIVILADARRQAEILRGEGDGKATEIYNQAYGQDPKFFDFYRSMQALANSLNSDTTTYVGPASGDFFRYFGAGNQFPPAAGGSTGSSP